MKTYTTGQVAKICRVAPRTVSKWFDSGRLKGYRLPGSEDRRIPHDALVKFLREANMPQADEVENSAKFNILTIGLELTLLDRLVVSNDNILFTHVPNMFNAGQAVAKSVPDILVIDAYGIGGLEMAGAVKTLRASELLTEVTILALTCEDGTETVEGADLTFKRPLNVDEVTLKLFEGAAA